MASNWFPAARRGRALGILGTSYQFMASVTFLVAGASVEWLGWRGAFYVPAVLLAASAVHMLVFLRESPDERTAGPRPHRSRPGPGHWTDNVLVTLTNPALWVLAVTLFLLDACRYFFTGLGPGPPAGGAEGQRAGDGRQVRRPARRRDRRRPVRRVGHRPLSSAAAGPRSSAGCSSCSPA